MAEVLIPNNFSNPRFGLTNDENRKLFLGGLSWETEEKDLLDYFNRFGKVDKVTIKYDVLTGRSRGFGFVVFAQDETVDAVLKNGPHVIKNRAVDPKRPKGKSGLKKIFVGGVDGDVSNEEIKAYFEKFGTIENIERPFDRQRNRSREFCFIIFESGQAAESAISLPKQIIGGKECDIKLAHPQRNNSNSGINHQGGGRRNFNGNGGAGGPPVHNVFFKGRNQNHLNNNPNWRDSEHQNGGFRGFNDDPYSDFFSQFLSTIDSFSPTNGNFSNYKSNYANNSNYFPY